MKFSFESPLELLGDSLRYNDYEYALVHLFENKEYLEFYERSILDRKMYLDNSAYELGESFDPKEYRKWVEHFANIKAENLYYFLPDYPGDSKKTLAAAKKFKPVVNATSIGVVHAKGYEDAILVAKELAKHCDMLAIPMLPAGFEGAESLQERTEARIKLVKILHSLKGTVIPNKRIHLLGCLLPQEFREYKDEVYSADTSNPVVHGIEGVLYGENGLDCKSCLKLCDLLDIKLTPKQRKDILNNITAFYHLNRI